MSLTSHEAFEHLIRMEAKLDSHLYRPPPPYRPERLEVADLRPALRSAYPLQDQYA